MENEERRAALAEYAEVAHLAGLISRLGNSAMVAMDMQAGLTARMEALEERVGKLENRFSESEKGA